MSDNRKETLMRKIQMYAFTAHECALYLDCHPDNKQALAKHARAVKEMNEATKAFTVRLLPKPQADRAGIGSRAHGLGKTRRTDQCGAMRKNFNIPLI